MENNTNPTKSRRSAAEIREEHKQFVELYNSGLTPFELMRKLNISKVQYKKHFADAIVDGEVTLMSHEYGTCLGKHLFKELRQKLQATKEDLIRFEITEKGVLLIKLDN
jgi:hypothetical protein